VRGNRGGSGRPEARPEPTQPGRRDVKGFGVRVTAAGAKAFILNYRAGERERRYTIGGWPEWSVAAARSEAAQLRREIDRGRVGVGSAQFRNAEPILPKRCRSLRIQVALASVRPINRLYSSIKMTAK
jgi:Arm domain-containing DNA-binding protein